MKIKNKDKLYDSVKNQDKDQVYSILDREGETGFFYPNDNYGYETLLHVNASLKKEIFNPSVFEILCYFSTGYINLKDSYERTALTIACMRNNISAIIKLLSYGADFTLCDLYGKKPFDYISNYEVRLELEDYLLAPFSKRGSKAQGVPYWLDDYKKFVFSNKNEEFNFLLNLLAVKTKDVKDFILQLESFDIKMYVIFEERSRVVSDLKFVKKEDNNEYFLTQINPNFIPEKFIRKLDINYKDTINFLIEQNERNTLTNW